MGSLLEEFNVKIKATDLEVNDYNVFEDKGLLDGFRIQILELLSDKGFDYKQTPKSVINDLIDEVCYGLVKLLGYSQIAEYNGGYPDGYRKVTSELDLLKGVNLSFSSFVSGREMLETYGQSGRHLRHV